jgi:hypothetical protein
MTTEEKSKKLNVQYEKSTTVLDIKKKFIERVNEILYMEPYKARLIIESFNILFANSFKHMEFLDKIQVGDKVTRNSDGVLVNLSQLNRVAKKEDHQKTKNKINVEQFSNLTELVKYIMKNAIECGDFRDLDANVDLILEFTRM